MNTETELKTVESTSVVTNPDNLIAMAIEKGTDIDQLTKLFDLKERYDKDIAKKAFTGAMNLFKANPPTILKDQHVSYETTKGMIEYDHAGLENVVQSISERLAEYGLSHRWDIDQLEGGQIKVTCVITHVLGYSIGVPLQSGADQSGGKNNIQAIASTVTYLQRYTLLSAVGLATKCMDDDGRKSEPTELITEEQANSIHSRIDDNDLGMERFIKWLMASLKVSKIEDINVNGYGIVDSMLDAQIKGKNK